MTQIGGWVGRRAGQRAAKSRKQARRVAELDLALVVLRQCAFDRLKRLNVQVESQTSGERIVRTKSYVVDRGYLFQSIEGDWIR